MNRGWRDRSAALDGGRDQTARGRVARSVGSLCVIVMIVGGCKSEAGKKPAVDPPEIGRGSAEEVARGVIETIREELKAAAARDKEGVAAARKRLKAVAHADVIVSRYPKELGATREQMVDAAVESWGRIVAYYADGLNLEGLSLVERNEGTADVFVPYSGARGVTRGSVTVRIECRVNAGVWSVARLDFAGVQAASQPSSSSG